MSTAAPPRRTPIGTVIVPLRITGRWIVNNVPGMTYDELHTLKLAMHNRGWDGLEPDEQGAITGDFSVVLEALRTSKR